MNLHELIERLRSYKYGEEHAMTQAAEAIEQLAAALSAKDEALEDAVVHIDSKSRASAYERALALQPHAELVAKMKADAVIRFTNMFEDHAEYFGSFIQDSANNFADRIERGEVK